MLLNRGVNKFGGVKQPTFGNGLSNKGIAAGKHPHNGRFWCNYNKGGPRPVALIETTQTTHKRELPPETTHNRELLDSALFCQVVNTRQ